jgi:hypothetical protein
VHTPITVEHNGINASITENGHIQLSKVARVIDKDTVEFDEIEIPASLIFKLARLLKDTRRIKYVSIGDYKGQAEEQE